MKFFPRRPAPAGVTLLNAWCSPFEDVARVGAMHEFVTALLEFVEPSPIDGEINFGRPRSLPMLLRGIATMQASDVETLMLFDARGEAVLSVGMASGTTAPDASCFRVHARFPPQAHRAEAMLDFLMTRAVHYAYIRALPAGFDAASETRIRRSLLGVTIKPGSFRDWLVPERDVRSGAVRGVYPVNVLSDRALQRLAATGLALPASLPQRGGTVWRLSAEDKAELLRRNPTRADVLHLDDA